jgi:hypothetical protein
VPVLCELLPALVPLQSPLAVHDVGLLVALQVIVELLPVVVVIGLALMVTTGTGWATTSVAVSVTPAAVVAWFTHLSE